MLSKKLITLFSLAIIFSDIVTLFWYQEMSNMLPTPVPENYKGVLIGNQVKEFPAMLSRTKTDNGKITMLHFFNPDYPCYNFNIAHFRSLVKQYSVQADFYAVLQTEEESGATGRFQEKYNLSIPVIIDARKKLATACGIHSTPQAAIIDQNGILYYRSNYNKARYYTTTKSNFVQMALDSLLAGKKPPVFTELATFLL